MTNVWGPIVCVCDVSKMQIDINYLPLDANFNESKENCDCLPGFHNFGTNCSCFHFNGSWTGNYFDVETYCQSLGEHIHAAGITHVFGYIIYVILCDRSGKCSLDGLAKMAFLSLYTK